MSKPSSLKKMLLSVCKAAGLTEEEIAEGVKHPATQALTLKSDDGTEIEIEREEGEPQVGDNASPDGEHHMPDGSVIVIENGKITEIRPKEEEQPAEEPATDEEKETLKQENQSLKDQNAELQRKLDEALAAKKSKADIEALSFIEECGGLEQVKSLRSSYTPPAPEGGKRPDPQAPKSKLDEEYENLFNS